MLDLPRRRHADRVGEDDLPRVQLTRQLLHHRRIDASLERAAERDADRDGRRQFRDSEDRPRLRHCLVERHVSVPLVERLCRRERAVDAIEHGFSKPLVAAEVEDEAGVRGAFAPLDPVDHCLGVRHLRDPVRADEASRLDAREARRREAVDQLGADRRRQRVRLVLEPVARPDVTDRHHPRGQRYGSA